MSVDIIARSLALVASPVSSTAEAIPTLRLATSVGVIQTSGYAIPGIGAALYVADGLANAALAAAHPLFCKADAASRYFRLLIPEDGLIPIACAGVNGTATPVHTTNHQPGIMAAIAYSEAVGGRGIRLEPKHYSVWVPNRVPVNYDWFASTSGVPIAPTLALTIEFGGGTLWRRAPLGADPTVAAKWQIITGQLWRGGAFIVQPRVAVAPANYADRPHLTLRNGAIMGGLPRGTNYQPVAATLANGGDCWDINDKCIGQTTDQFNGTVTITDMVFDGFRGEMIYATNDVTSALVIDRLKVSNTNAQPLNPNGTRLHVRAFEADTVGWVFEGFGGEKGYFQGVIRNAVNGGYIQGGKPFSGAPYATPTRVTASEAPYFTLDLELRNCGTGSQSVMLGSWLRGRLRLVDTSILIGNPGTVPECYDIELAVECVLDQIANLSPVAIYGTTAVAGDKKTDNVTLDVTCRLTKAAKVAGRKFSYPFTFNNSLGSNILVKLTYNGADAANPVASGNISGTPDYWPRVEGDAAAMAGNVTGWGASLQDIGTTPLVMKLPVVGLYKATAGVTAVGTLPATNLVVGHKIRLHSLDTNGYLVFAGTANGGQIRGAGVIIAPSQFVDIAFDGYQWIVTREPPPLQLTVALLPTASVSIKGCKAFVTDALAPAFGAAVAAGGAVYTPVYCDGAAWKVG